MALELRPNCEYCDWDLPPTSLLARICTYECTFCSDCVADVLFNVCTNCGGGFAPAPFDRQLNSDPDFRLRDVRLRINGASFL